MAAAPNGLPSGLAAGMELDWSIEQSHLALSVPGSAASFARPTSPYGDIRSMDRIVRALRGTVEGLGPVVKVPIERLLWQYQGHPIVRL